MSDLHLTLRYRHDAAFDVLVKSDPHGLGSLLRDLNFEDEGNASAAGRYDAGRLVLPSGNRELQLWLYDIWTQSTIDAVAAASNVVEATVTEIHDSGGWITEFRPGAEPRKRDCDGDGHPVLTAATFAALTAGLGAAQALDAVASFFEATPFTLD